MNLRHQSLNQNFLYHCPFSVPLQWPTWSPFIENIIFCWSNEDGALIFMCSVPIELAWLRPDASHVAHVHKDVNWLKSASLDMHNYVSWCLRISMRLYFAILGVGKRSLWCAGFTDPPKPSGWYRKYIGNRTIEETSANQEILTSL